MSQTSNSPPGQDSQSYGDMASRGVSTLGGRLGPLGEFAKGVLQDGAIAAGVAIIVSTGIMLALFTLLSSQGTLNFSFAAAVVSGILNFGALPYDVAVNGAASVVSLNLANESIQPPATIVTFILLAVVFWSGRRGGKRGGVGWPAGIAIAFVYATILTLVATILSGDATMSSASSGSSFGASFTIGPRLPATWFYAFGWAVIPATIGAIFGAGDRAILDGWWVRVQRWQAPLAGALTATAVVFVLSLFVVILTLMVYLFNPDANAAVALKAGVLLICLVYAPVAGVFTQVISMGASVTASGSISTSLASPSASASLGLLNNWPLSAFGYLLPLIPLVGCTCGAIVVLRRTGRPADAYKMAVPFVGLNVVLAWMTSMSGDLRPGADLGGIVGNIANLLSNINGLGNITSSSSFQFSFGPSIWQVVLGSTVVALLGGVAATVVTPMLDVRLNSGTWPAFVGPPGPSRGSVAPVPSASSPAYDTPPTTPVPDALRQFFAMFSRSGLVQPDPAPSPTRRSERPPVEPSYSASVDPWQSWRQRGTRSDQPTEGPASGRYESVSPAPVPTWNTSGSTRLEPTDDLPVVPKRDPSPASPPHRPAAHHESRAPHRPPTQPAAFPTRSRQESRSVEAENLSTPRVDHQAPSSSAASGQYGVAPPGRVELGPTQPARPRGGSRIPLSLVAAQPAAEPRRAPMQRFAAPPPVRTPEPAVIPTSASSSAEPLPSSGRRGRAIPLSSLLTVPDQRIEPTGSIESSAARRARRLCPHCGAVNEDQRTCANCAAPL